MQTISRENVRYYKNKSYNYVEHDGGLHIVKSRVILIDDKIAILKNGKKIHIDNLFLDGKIKEIQAILDNNNCL